MYLLFSPPTGKPRLLIASVSSGFVRCRELLCELFPADSGSVDAVSMLRVSEPWSDLYQIENLVN